PLPPRADKRRGYRDRRSRCSPRRRSTRAQAAARAANTVRYARRSLPAPTRGQSMLHRRRARCVRALGPLLQASAEPLDVNRLSDETCGTAIVAGERAELYALRARARHDADKTRAAIERAAAGIALLPGARIRADRAVRLLPAWVGRVVDEDVASLRSWAVAV